MELSTIMFAYNKYSNKYQNCLQESFYKRFPSLLDILYLKHLEKSYLYRKRHSYNGKAII
jgi:hypothetical protein